ncbi:MAG TPA: NAD(P)H-dependent glycerol-3-phosphate dehydrogenase [Verrucomicrobiota bacterium]|nr:NAD(P)H-dependent glycerol-3-phosphate dehydrogenase [Verrucomicrobiota bacterium]HNU51334.1 NAD(P)H-dependent glycerol-3-phosphate dehydrogenase [Verrucomicrobiota bacterium]
MRIAVLGMGAWGTALARQMGEGGHTLTVWDHDAANLREVAKTGRNQKYLPGVVLCGDWRVESVLDTAWRGSDLVLLAVPSKAFRAVSRVLAEHEGTVVTVTKGIEYDTGLTMSGVLLETAPRARAVALSGPTLAMEVARGVPTAAVAASRDPEGARQVQGLLHRPAFRVYTSRDLLGVELGGALKNVMAIAAGVCDGLGFGDNSKAALVTRAVVEICRLGVACGAQAGTFSGLSGLGDLVVTCFSRLSRNRMLGERLGRGEALDQILGQSVSVAEGYPTARAAWRLAQRLGVAAPIIEQVHAMLYEGKNVADAVRDVTHRDHKAEDE